MALPDGWVLDDSQQAAATPTASPGLPQGWALDPSEAGANEANSAATAIQGAGGLVTGEEYGRAYQQGYRTAATRNAQLAEQQAAQTIVKRLEPQASQTISQKFNSFQTLGQLGDMYQSAYNAAHNTMWGSWGINAPGMKTLSRTHPEVQAYESMMPDMAIKISKGLNNLSGGDSEAREREINALPQSYDNPATAYLKLYNSAKEGYKNIYNSIQALQSQNYDVSAYIPMLKQAMDLVQDYKGKAMGVYGPKSGAPVSTTFSPQTQQAIQQKIGGNRQQQSNAAPSPMPSATPAAASNSFSLTPGT